MGGFTALAYTWLKDKHASIGATLNGILAGLVGITAGAHVITPFHAIFVGLITSLIVTISIEVIDKKIKIDDPVGAISVHGIGGVIGTILVSVFHQSEGIVSGNFDLIGIQLFGSLFIALISTLFGLSVAFLLKKTIGIRVKKEEEIEGLDIHEHQTSSYPNFTISATQKSE
jgi:Amt family ammonium transporter